MRNLVLFSALIIGTPFLAACDLKSDTNLTPNRVQVQEEKFVEEIPVADMDEELIAGLAKHYNRHGDGMVDLTVTYDPQSRSSTAMTASNQASRIIKSFRKHGLRNVHAGVLPVKGQGSDALVIISYTSYTAHAPKDCGVLAGMEDTDINVEHDYKLGCTVETVFAKQIARPKDLKGRAQTDPTSDGRRASNIIELHRTGAPNEPLGGESASGE